jgi:hypothetical protein
MILSMIGYGFLLHVTSPAPNDVESALHYQPDFIVRLRDKDHVIVETKGFDDLADVKKAAADRWVAAVNAEGGFGRWRYVMARSVAQVRTTLDDLAAQA